MVERPSCWDWQSGKEDVFVLDRVLGLPATVVGVEAHERVTAEDYEKVVIRAVRAAEAASSGGEGQGVGRARP